MDFLSSWRKLLGFFGAFFAMLFDRFLRCRQLHAASDTIYLVPYVRCLPIVCKRVTLCQQLKTKYSSQLHLSVRESIIPAVLTSSYVYILCVMHSFANQKDAFAATQRERSIYFLSTDACNHSFIRLVLLVPQA